MRTLTSVKWTCVVLLGFGFVWASLSTAGAQDAPAEEATPEQQALQAEFDAQYARFAELINQRKLAEAIAVGERAVEMSERLEKNSIATTALLDTLGRIHQLLGDFAASERAYRQAADIMATIFGEEDWGVADARWKAKRVALLGTLSPEDRDELKRAGELQSAAVAAAGKSDTPEAVRLQRESLAIQERLLPSPHPDLADCLGVLGVVLRRNGDLVEAGQRLNAALAMLEALYPASDYPDGHPYLAIAVSNVASLQRSMGDSIAAHKGYQRSYELFLALYPPEYGPKDQLGTAAAVLGKVESELGDYAAARDHLEQAVEIFEALLPATERQLADAMEPLASVLVRLGELDLAQARYEEGIERLEKLYPRADFPHGNTSLGAVYLRLASLHSLRKNHDAARKLGVEALAMYEAIYSIEKFPRGHVDLAAVWNNYALILEAAGDLAEARAYSLRSLAANEQLYPIEEFPQGHPELAAALSNAALMYLKADDLEQAQTYFDRSRAMNEKIYSSQFYPQGHDSLVNCWTNYAVFEFRRGRLNEALTLLIEAAGVKQLLLEDVLGDVSEQTMHRYMVSQQGTSNLLLSVLAAVDQPRPSDVDRVYRLLLDRKTAVIDALLRARGRQEAAAGDEELAQLIFELRAARQAQADLALRPAGAERAENEVDPAQLTSELEARLNRLLADQEKSSEDLMPAAPIEVVIGETVAEYAGDGALVDILRYHPYDFQMHERQSPRYAAFVLRGKKGALHQLVDLGPAEKIDGLVAELRKQVESTSRALAAADEDELEEQYREPARALYDLVMAPLKPALDGATTIYLSPDGELTRIPFEALVDERGRYLIESLSFDYLFSGRDLMLGKVAPEQGTLIFAAPDYRYDGQPVPPSDQLAGFLRGTPESDFHGDLSPELRGLNWSPLPATIKEAAEIAAILDTNPEYGPVVQLTGAAALEDTLKDLRKAPRILHLATHGYYLPNQVPEGDAEGHASEGDRGGVTAAAGLGSLKKLENPLLRSGIVLAGANRPQRDEAEGNPTTQLDDGWVTAEEIGLLNLKGTELVVLSACETGLGDIRTGEGVSGLRRAFLYAGARTLVTSLYKVPDGDTQLLMTDFYRGLAANKPKLQALRDAELAAIARRRKSEGAAHPFFWASFILVGDPR